MGKISNKKILLYTFLVKVSVILRLIFAPTIFIFPRLTAIVSLIFDWVDGELYKRAGYDHSQYGTYDKILDYYWYVWILFYILMNNVPYKLLFIGLFFYRTIG